MSADKSSQILGGLWGALTGDALGVPVEFKERATLDRDPVKGMRAYGTHGQPAGTWSDDSSMLLCTVESLVDRKELDTEDLAARFVQWKSFGHWTPHGSVFDIGITTSHAINRMESGVAPELAGGADQYDNGNGSLMRILPIGFAFAKSTHAALAGSAAVASTLTHRHARSQMACAYYCLLVRELLEGKPPAEAYTLATARFVEWCEPSPWNAERLAFQMLEDGRLSERERSKIGSGGYVMHTLAASVWCLLTSATFEETVLKAVNLGGDTDTTGTVAGGLAGIVYGVDAIPTDWRRQLSRAADVGALFSRFLQTIEGAEFQKR